MIRVIRIFLLGLIITGCTSIPPVKTPPAAPKATWKDRVSALERIQNWRLSGKIAVRTKQDAGSATVTWIRHLQQYSISLHGPLGSHSMQLSGNPGRVTLQTADGKTLKANTPEQLLAKAWGFLLPISNLNYWIRGLPVPGIASLTQFDQYGRLTSLKQQGWHIRYTSYANTGGIDLPRQLSLSSPSLTVRMIVYQWNL